MSNRLQWNLQLQLPPWAQEERIPGAMWDLLRIVTISHDAYIYDLETRRRYTGSPAKRWRVPVRETEFWAGHVTRADLLRMLRGYWCIPIEPEFVPSSEAQPVGIRIAGAHDPGSAFRGALTAVTPADDDIEVLLYSHTMDAMAAVCQHVGDTRRQLALVSMGTETRGAASPGGQEFAPGIRQRLHPIRTLVGNDSLSLAERRVPLELLHLVLTSIVALAADRDRVFFPQDGIASLQLPVTMMSAGAVVTPRVNPSVSAALASLITRISGKDFHIVNPLEDSTPADAARLILDTRSVMADSFQPISLVRHASLPRQQQDLAISLICASRGVGSLPEPARQQLEDHFSLAMNDSRVSMFIHNLRELSTLPSTELRGRLDKLPGVHWLIRHNQYDRVRGLLTRHIQEVMDTLIALVHGASRQLIQGTLPLSSFLGRTLYPPDLEPVRHPTFKQRGEMWVLWFEAGDTVYMEDLLGLRYIHHLLQFPGSSYSAMALRAQAEGQGLLLSGSIDVLDEIAIRSLKSYIDTVRKSVVAAEQENRPDAAREHRAELEKVEAELNRAVGLGGRVRKSSDMEKARRAVSSTIHRALGRLHEALPALAIHLRNHLHIGTHLRYTPDDDIEWIT